MKLRYSILLIASAFTFTTGAETHSSKNLPGSTVARPGKECGTILNFIVIDLMTKISRKNVIGAVKAVAEQVRKDWAPNWGNGAKFKVLKRGFIPSAEQTQNAVIVYLFNDLTPANIQPGVGGFHSLTTADAKSQPKFFIGDQIPLIPTGTPYIIIPFGNGTYGLSDLLSPKTLALFPKGFNIGDALSFDLSHETLETLGNTFGTNTFQDSQQSVADGLGISMFTREVCDPVEFPSKINVYKRNNFFVTNFVLPQYFNFAAQLNTKFDFLGNVQKPLTPFIGLQNLTRFNFDGSILEITKTSLIQDPTVIRETVTVAEPACRLKNDSDTKLSEHKPNYHVFEYVTE